MPDTPVKLRVRPARRTSEQLLREEVLVVSATRTAPAALRVEALEQRLPGGQLVAESTDATAACDEPLRPPRLRDSGRAQPRIANQPCDPLVARSVPSTSWAFADRYLPQPAPLPHAVRFVPAAAMAEIDDAMAVVKFNPGGQIIGGHAANLTSLRYVVSGEVGGWVADVSAA